MLYTRKIKTYERGLRFVGGEFVGGATDAFDQWRDGTLQQLLEKAGVGFSAEQTADPYSFLPTWLHPR